MSALVPEHYVTNMLKMFLVLGVASHKASIFH